MINRIYPQIRYIATAGLPSGVTLQAIDGETMTSPTVMSNNYYARNGLTYAANAGWDNPSFFPIGIFVKPDFYIAADFTRLTDLNTNVINATSQQAALATGSLNLMQTDGLWLITSGFTDGSSNGAVEEQSTHPVVVGNVTQDEPTTTAIAVTNPIVGATSIAQDGRLWHMNGTWVFAINNLPPSPTGFDCFGQGNGPPPTAQQVLTTTAITPGGHTRHIEMVSTDNYWFAGARSIPPQNFILQGGFYLNYGIGRNFTADEAARACRYGDIVDFLRSQQTTYSIPMANYIENGGPYTQNTTAASYIQPPELNAAVWASIIHGARHIIYFNETFAGPAGTVFDNFATAYFQTIQAGQSISIYNQAKATNAAVKALAPVLNSPFALNYVTVSPAGWKYGTASWPLTGFDVMAKWYSNQFYIFAIPRYSATLTNQTATFTIVNTGATTVTVLNESRTIPITNGGTQFVDTFATGNTVHIYRVG